jgi:nitronate monooxygenase
MFKTRFTELFGVDHPIIGGCLLWISTPEFVAAISNAGALGLMPSANCQTQDEFRAAVKKLKSLTDKPFGVNLSLFPALRPIDNELYVQVILEEEVPVVETSGHKPPEKMLARLQEAGIKTMHKCASVQHALSAEKAGVDAVTVFGSEGGGHIGDLGLTTMALVPAATDALKIPVLAAGGIADGRGLLAALALGAEGVTIGTRLMVTEESPIHDNIKKAYVAARETDTQPILSSLHNTLRVWKNQPAMKVAELEAQKAEMQEILAIASGKQTMRMIQEGNLDTGVLSCSQSVGVMTDIKPVALVIKDMVTEAAAIRDGVGK